MLLKKKISICALLFVLLLSTVSYASTCEVSKVKQVLRKVLYLYFTDPSSSPLALDEVKDLLVFYLSIGEDLPTTDCSVTGSNSNVPISDILVSGENVADLMPACPDGTKYGECSSFRPRYCYSGSLVNRCNYCGCPSASGCSTEGKCTPVSTNITCFANRDCGPSDFVGDYYCSNNFITRNYVNKTCIYPGTTSSACVAFDSSIRLNYCDTNSNQICVDGASACSEVIATNQTRPSNITLEGVDGTWCYDSDGNGGYYTQGYCQDKDGTYSDFCNLDTVRDYYCTGLWNGATWSSVKCQHGGLDCVSGGYVCLDGACNTPANQTTLCTDSDNGLNYYVQGIATKGIVNAPDYCGAQQANGSQYVLEQYCDASSNTVQFPYLCSGPCNNGACSNQTQISLIQVTTNTANQRGSKIYGNRIVWEDFRNGNWDIYIYDLTTSQEARITYNNRSQESPYIYGNIIVWQDNRNGNYDIYMYDLSTAQERRITNHTANQYYPIVYDNRIVYMDYKNGNPPYYTNNPDIYMYDLSTGQETRITPSTAWQYDPFIYGNKVAWKDTRNGNDDIYVYDLATSQEVPLITNTRTQMGPYIYSNNLVWWDYRNGPTPDVYVYDFDTGQETRVTSDPAWEYVPTAYGNKIVWEDTNYGNGDIVMYDFFTGQKTNITDDTAVQSWPHIYGNKIVWTDWRNGDFTTLTNSDIYMATIS